jgi:hypothetical protein
VLGGKILSRQLIKISLIVGENLYFFGKENY